MLRIRQRAKINSVMIYRFKFPAVTSVHTIDRLREHVTVVFSRSFLMQPESMWLLPDWSTATSSRRQQQTPGPKLLCVFTSTPQQQNTFTR